MTTPKKAFKVIGVSLCEDTKKMAKDLEAGLNFMQKAGYDIRLIENDSGVLIVGSDTDMFGEDGPDDGPDEEPHICKHHSN